MTARLLSLAVDLHLSNTSIPVHQFKSFLRASRVWWFPWGAIAAQGNMTHIHVLTTHRKRALFRKELRQVAADLFAEYEEIRTSVLKTKPQVYDFDIRLGWKLESEDDKQWNFVMTKKDFDHVWN